MKQRIANNKNIQTEQKDIDIYEILKGTPTGTGLYTPLSGKVGLSYIALNKEAGEAILVKNKGGEYSFNKNGRWMEGGEVLLFPSNEMRDWSKFFKKGDVLVSEDGGAHIIFEKFEDDTYTTFIGKHYFDGDDKLGYSYISGRYTANTKQFRIEEGDAVQTYIKTIEEKSVGKLNLETLEIEKPAFEIGKLYVFREEDEDGELTIIGKLIDKNESEDTLTFGYQYEIENENFVTDQTFDLRISVNKELREATEDEYCTFKEAYTLWEKEPKKPMDKPAFKTFDKVLVRLGKEFKWLPAFFIRDRGESFTNRYNVLPLHTGKPADFTSCIQYEGHENFAFTDYDFVDLPF